MAVREMKDIRHLKVLYRNHEGKVAIRNIIPMGIWFGTSEYHQQVSGSSCFMDCVCLDKKDARTFHMPDILAIGDENIKDYLHLHPNI